MLPALSSTAATTPPHGEHTSSGHNCSCTPAKRSSDAASCSLCTPASYAHQLLPMQAPLFCLSPPAAVACRRKPAVSPEPTGVSPRSIAGPAAPSVQSYMIRQHFYVVAPIEISDCSEWLASTNKPAYVRSIAALVRLQSVRLECQYSGIELNADLGSLANDTSVAGAGFDGVVDEKQSEGSSSLLRVSILGLTGRMSLSEAKRIADGLNRAVVDGRFARLVQQNGGSADELQRAADGYCVVGYTPCPPEDI